MKVCPKCGATYQDETLNFCLEDGSVLNVAAEGMEPPPTVMMQEPPPATVESPANPTMPQAQAAVPVGYTMPKKRSKAWIWVMLALFAVVVVCGGGFIGLIAIGSLDPGDDGPPIVDDKDKDSKPPEDTKDRKVVNRADMEEWPDVLGRFDGLDVEYRRGELYVNTKRNFYYVISTGDQFPTSDAIVNVTVRNPSARAVTFGYGLVVHSDPVEVLKRDIAFLIRSDTREYRVVRHSNKQETVLVKWTDSKAIRGGSAKNELEVRCDGSEMHFYINGDFVKTVTDRSDHSGGVAGLYTSDDVPVAFSDLELRR